MSPSGRSTRVDLVVGAAQAGLRLDQFLAAAAPDLSRRRARTLLDIGGVFVDGRRCKRAGLLVEEGQAVAVNLGPALARATTGVGTAARAADAAHLPPYQVVFEDEQVVVVDKPAGLLAAPTPEGDRNTLSDLLARRSGVRATIFVVHRIDLPTSGLLVFAKTEAANRALGERFRTHDVGRAYFAVVAGTFPDAITRIDRKIGGRIAVTHVEVAERFAAATLLRVRLETGRTHQIRIHCRGVGHPVLGDPTVSEKSPGVPSPPRMALHACHLAFVHPATGAQLSFESPWPEDLTDWIAAVRGTSGATG